MKRVTKSEHRTRCMIQQPTSDQDIITNYGAQLEALNKSGLHYSRDNKRRGKHTRHSEVSNNSLTADNNPPTAHLQGHV